MDAKHPWRAIVCVVLTFTAFNRADFALTASCPTEPALLQRQCANALACRGEDGVAHCRKDRRQGWLTEPGRRIIGLSPVNLDWRNLPHAQQRMVVEVRLH